MGAVVVQMDVVSHVFCRALFIVERAILKFLAHPPIISRKNQRLCLLLSSYCPTIVRLSAKDFGFDGTVFSVPLYAAVLVGEL